MSVSPLKVAGSIFWSGDRASLVIASFERVRLNGERR